MNKALTTWVLKDKNCGNCEHKTEMFDKDGVSYYVCKPIYDEFTPDIASIVYLSDGKDCKRWEEEDET